MEPVTVRVGKKGLTSELLRELEDVLHARGVVKVKLLKSFREAYGVDCEVKGQLAEMLAAELTARIVRVQGYAITLARRGRRRGEPPASQGGSRVRGER